MRSVIRFGGSRDPVAGVLSTASPDADERWTPAPDLGVTVVPVIT